MLPQRVTAVAALSIGVKGSTVVVRLVLGGASEPPNQAVSRAPKFPAELAPLASLKIGREIVHLSC